MIATYKSNNEAVSPQPVARTFGERIYEIRSKHRQDLQGQALVG